MRPFILIELEDSEIDTWTTPPGVEITVIEIDWETAKSDASVAHEKKEEILAQYLPGEEIGVGRILDVLALLDDAIESGEEEADDLDHDLDDLDLDDPDDEDDEEDDMDEFLDGLGDDEDEHAHSSSQD